jgi:sugar lactone lactonase YvrE
MRHKYSVRHGVVLLVFLAACGLAACGDGSSTPVSQITSPPPMLSVLAGDPLGAAGDMDGPGGGAAFNQPSGITTDSAGNVYVADSGNRAIRKITPAGVVTTLSQIPQPADFHATDTYGSGIVVDGADVVYSVEDKSYYGPVGPEFSYFSSTLVSSAGRSQGLASCRGTMYSGASCPGAGGISIDPAGNVSFARDQTVNMITPAGIETTLAGTTGVYGGADGTGAAASFDSPWGIAIDKVGNLYVTDGNNTIRKVTSAGVVTTLAGTANVAGSADGTGPVAEFQGPEGIVVDSDGNAYVADSRNNTVRKITPAGVVTTVIGQPGLAGFIPGALPGRLSNPTAVALFGTTLYVTCGNAVVQVTNVP